MMTYLLNDLGALIGIAYTIAMLGHILHRGFIAKTLTRRTK